MKICHLGVLIIRTLSKVPLVYYMMKHISTGARTKEKTFAWSSAAAALVSLLPSAHVQCPVSKVQCPMVSVQCPVVSVQCPVLNVQCPLFLCSGYRVKISMTVKDTWFLLIRSHNSFPQLVPAHAQLLWNHFQGFVMSDNFCSNPILSSSTLHPVGEMRMFLFQHLLLSL